MGTVFPESKVATLQSFRANSPEWPVRSLKALGIISEKDDTETQFPP